MNVKCFLEKADKTQFMQELQKNFNEAKNRKLTDFIIFYSGHGLSEKGAWEVNLL